MANVIHAIIKLPRLWGRLYATAMSICLFVSLSVCRLERVYRNAVFSKTKQFRAIVSIDDQ